MNKLGTLAGFSSLVLTVVLAGMIMFNFPQLLGFENAYMVRSGSMEPAIPVGSVIFVEKSRPENIQKGDIITFQKSGGPIRITHRVVGIRSFGDERQFRTRGDANSYTDREWVPDEYVTGEVSLVVPWLGYLIYLFDSLIGFIILVGLPALSVLIYGVQQYKRD